MRPLRGALVAFSWADDEDRTTVSHRCPGYGTLVLLAFRSLISSDSIRTGAKTYGSRFSLLLHHRAPAG